MATGRAVDTRGAADAAGPAGRFVPVRAALVVDARQPSFATRLYPDWWIDGGGDHYLLELAARERRRGRR